MIRILVADDHPMIRDGLAAAIAREADLTLVASAADGREAISMFREHRPDITLMDLKMPHLNGLEAIRAIREESPSAKIIVLSTYEGDEDIYRALDAGAVTYLLKDLLAEGVIQAIREVAGGGRSLPANVSRKLAERMFQPALTNREVDVVRLIARGLRNKEIAAELNISEETVQGYVKQLFAKLSVHDRTEAVAVAVRRGIVHID